MSGRLAALLPSLPVYPPTANVDDLDRIDAHPAFKVERVGAARQGLVTRAVDCGDLVADEIVARSCRARGRPSRSTCRTWFDRSACFRRSGSHRRLRRTEPTAGPLRRSRTIKRRIELGLHEGLLHVDERVLGRAVRVVPEVGREVGREDVVKLVVDDRGRSASVRSACRFGHFPS